MDEIVQLRSTVGQTFYEMGPGPHPSSKDEKAGAEPRDSGWTEYGIGRIAKECSSYYG